MQLGVPDSTIRIGLSGTPEVVQLRAALKALATRVPSADPGAEQPGDPGAVTDQMLSALISLVSRISFPSEVKVALSLLAVGVSFAPASVKEPVRAVVSRYGSTLAKAIALYTIKLGGAASTVHYPSGTIATPGSGGLYRIAIPIGTSLSGHALGTHGGSQLGASVFTIDGACVGCIPDGGRMFGATSATHTEVTQGALPSGGVKVVTPSDFDKAIGKPIYKKGWFWAVVGGAVVVVAGGVVTVVMLRRKKRRN